MQGQCPKNIVVTPGNYKVVLKKELGDKSYYYYETQISLGDNVTEKIDGKLERVNTEDYYYSKAKSSNSIADYDVYIKNYPEGAHVAEIIGLRARKANSTYAYVDLVLALNGCEAGKKAKSILEIIIKQKQAVIDTEAKKIEARKKELDSDNSSGKTREIKLE